MFRNVLYMIDIKSDFPKPTQESIYLDSAASSITLNGVLEAMGDYYTNYRANIHRGLYPASEQATQSYDSARQTVASFIKANRVEEVIFTRGTTDALNMLAYMLEPQMEAGKKILIPVTEHHSNMLPWRELASRRGMQVQYIPMKQGVLDEEALFYLQDRGIGKENAKGLLLYAFTGEVLEHITVEPFKEYCLGLVQERLCSNF
jgi:cysteine desulfurase/selenocysteine lyase